MLVNVLAQSAILALLFPLASANRKITIINSCRQTIWPGIYSNPGPRPNHVHGWEMKPGESEDVEVSDTWNAGRIWARTGCVIQDGNFDCLTGNCGAGGGGAGLNGDMDCVNTNEIATLAEFTMTGHGNQDNYDISNVDGFNLPMSITPSVTSCRSPSCKANINEICPDVLRGGLDDNGANMMCMSGCKAEFGDTPAGNRACCNGQYKEAPDSCVACGVDYYEVFKEQCPDAYAHAYDERSETSLWTCKSELKSDYTIEFCPGSVSFIGATKASDQYISSTATCDPVIKGGSLEVRPSPTAGREKGHLKVKVQDGDIPQGGNNGPNPAQASGSSSDPGSGSGQQDHGNSSGNNGDNGGNSNGGDAAHQSGSTGTPTPAQPGVSAPAQQSGNAAGGGQSGGQNGGAGDSGNQAGNHAGDGAGNGGNGNNNGNPNGGNGNTDSAPAGEPVNLVAADAPSPSSSPSNSPAPAVTPAAVTGLVEGPQPHVEAPAQPSAPSSSTSGAKGGRKGRKQCPAKRHARK